MATWLFLNAILACNSNKEEVFCNKINIFLDLKYITWVSSIKSGVNEIRMVGFAFFAW